MHPATATLARASRPFFNAASSSSSSAAAFTTRQAFARATGTPFRSAYRRQQWGRRWQSTGGSSTADGAQQQQAQQQAAQSWFKRMWDSPVGLKTVHFWAPVMKWALVLAGVSDFARPAEKLSLTQNVALTATGFIWTRWCLIIKPKNYLLAAVNFFLGIVGITQCSRIALYNSSQKAEADKSVVEKVEDKVAAATTS